MRTHRTVFIAPLIAAALAAGCGAAGGPAKQAATVTATATAATAAATATATEAPAARAGTAQDRADAFATVAARLYREEATGASGVRNATRIAHDPAIVAALRSGGHARLRAAALRELFLPVRHVVRIRVVRGSRKLVDVGGAFVAAAESAPVPGGLGRVEVSMQDVLGLTKLVSRFTGAQIVVHGRGRDVIASTPAIRAVRMPVSGRVTAGGRPWVVRTIDRTGFGGEPLRISVLVPA